MPARAGDGLQIAAARQVRFGVVVVGERCSLNRGRWYGRWRGAGKMVNEYTQFVAT